jgi:tetratricopeptide (TPR) repeat protein
MISRISRGVACLLIGSIFLWSCIGGKKTPENPSIPADPKIAVKPTFPAISMTPVNPAISQAQLDIAAGNFQKALDTYQGEYLKKPKDTGVRESYLSALEHVRVHGDKAFDKGDFLPARSTYELLLKNFSRFSHFDNLLSFDRNFLVARVRMSRILGAELQAQGYLQSGDFQKAMGVYKGLYQQYPGDSQVWDGYARVLESIKNSADQAFQRNDLAAAGCAYRLLLKRGPSIHPAGRSLSYGRETLAERISQCRKALFDNALQQYRSGNLSQAILIWKSILSFDPEDSEVKKAVDMASLQSRNLERTR